MNKAISMFAVLALAHATELGTASEAEIEAATELEAQLQAAAQAEAYEEFDEDLLAQIEA